ncbi:hypothetical protein [Parvibaculum lavamentivorans]|uniref:hypothetical protein n=1 Tax=Parvibaculum lavamentivorans TaxID=256618 RepID=UPI0005A155B8|nr:hypothetical protein [Parvibaculum lavamentivorans]
MGKLVGGFVLGFLACVWTYGLNPTEAAFGFGHKISVTHERIQDEYRVDPSLGHKGQYRNFNSSSAAPQPESVDSLALRAGYWLSQSGGPPTM